MGASEGEAVLEGRSDQRAGLERAHVLFLLFFEAVEAGVADVDTMKISISIGLIVGIVVQLHMPVKK